MRTVIARFRPLLLQAPLFALAAPLAAQVTERVSVDTGNVQWPDASFNSSLSADGRFVAVVRGNGAWLRDRILDATQPISVTRSGSIADLIGSIAISADGRFVAFDSPSSDHVAGDTNGFRDVFVRDLLTATTERVSVATSGAEADDLCSQASISADGRFVAFRSKAATLVVGDDNDTFDVFVRDRQNGTTVLVSAATDGSPGNQSSDNPAISADGRYVAFASLATDIAPPDANFVSDVFVRDLVAGTTQLVSAGASGLPALGSSDLPAISADGRFVAFVSYASNFGLPDGNGTPDVYLVDRASNAIELVSVSSAGVLSNGASLRAAISGDGRRVAFSSAATNLVSGDLNGVNDLFVRDRELGTTERVSKSSASVQGNGHSSLPAVSLDGRFVGFASVATNLVAGDTNGQPDAFVRDLDADGFTSGCEPGTAGVLACPCGNPPAGPGQGCDNSSGTGGAALTAGGAAYLGDDTLTFVTSGEPATATSVLVQADATAPGGVVFGQGVACVGGSLRRLYVKAAVAGSIRAPDLPFGDAPVSVRSAELGDVILPGASRWYLVYYRDPVVLGGCPAASTFNTTQTGRVGWSL